MVKKPVTDKEPIIWGHRYWSYLERDMGGASCHLCGGLFVSMEFLQHNLLLLIISVIYIAIFSLPRVNVYIKTISIKHDWFQLIEVVLGMFFVMALGFIGIYLLALILGIFK